MLSGLDSVVSYFETMPFLDFQSDFVNVFGLEPTLYGTSPSKQEITDSIASQIQTYASKCMFDIFLSIFKMDYVGVDSKNLVGKMPHEICKQITNIAMEAKIGN